MPKDGSIPLISNELQVMLPLDLSEIQRPDLASSRKLDEDFYDEYIEIVDADDGKPFFQAFYFYPLINFFTFA